MKKLTLLLGLLVAGIGSMPSHAQATLTHVDISISGTGGLGGQGTSASDMVYLTFQVDQYGSGDGWGWAGGAGGVQGNSATTKSGGNSSPANEAFSFNLGSQVNSLNQTYGAGKWTIANPTLSFASSYAAQNNSRFGVGAGNFDIYWVGNDSWKQSRGTVDNRELNPIYANSASTLSGWSGSQALLGSETFSGTGSGYVSLIYSLDPKSALINDIVNADSTNYAVSLYLMGMSDSLGMIIFTGGQGQALPTLSFDVVNAPTPTPIPAAAWLFGSGLMGLAGLKRRKTLTCC